MKKNEERKNNLKSPGGKKYVVKLLTNVDPLDKKRLISDLEDIEPELAEDIKKDLCKTLEITEDVLFDDTPDHQLPD
jgi:flagellar motor switch protein FliG